MDTTYENVAAQIRWHFGCADPVTLDFTVKGVSFTVTVDDDEWYASGLNVIEMEIAKELRKYEDEETPIGWDF